MRSGRPKGSGIAMALCALCVSASAAVCEPKFTAGPIFRTFPNAGVNALVDMDADGDLDLLAGDLIFIGDGRGDVLRTPIRLSPPDYMIFDAAFADFDLDGRLDAALCRIGDQGVRFLFGQASTRPGKPVFGEPVTIPTIQSIWHLALGDFLEDGLPDLAAVSMGARAFSLLVNQGDRKFRSEPRGITTDAGHPVAAGDFDGDGHLDLAVGFGESVSLTFGKGDGKFRKTVSGSLYVPPNPIPAHRFRSADLDDDGAADLVAVGTGNVLIYLGREIARLDAFPGQPSRVLRIEGDGRFVAIDDMNGDGRLDVIAESGGNTNQAVVQIFFGDPDPAAQDPSFVAGSKIRTALSGHGSVLAVGDLDGDGAPDIVLTTEDTGDGQVFLNDRSCLRRARRGDGNADGVLDLGDAISALGYIILSIPIACPQAVEVNGDGQLDLADAVFLLNYLFASGSAPQGPSPVICRTAP